MFGNVATDSSDSKCECQGGRKRPSAKTLGAVLRRYYLEIRPERISNCSNDRDTYPCHLACRLPGTDLKLARIGHRGTVAGPDKSYATACPRRGQGEICEVYNRFRRS